jgi:hypothetical protein
VSPNLQIRRSVRLCPTLFCALLPATWCWAPPARAESSEVPVEDSIRLESSTCSHSLVDEVQRFLRVELKNTSIASSETAPRVILSCSERVSLIRALIGGHESTRQLDLARTDPALHARVIALAIAELLRDTAAGVAVEPPLVTNAAPPSKSAPAPAPAPEPEPAPSAPAPPATSHLVAFAKLENFGPSFEPLSGGGLTFSHELGHFSLGLGPTLATGQRKLALGSVGMLAADLSLRLAYRFPNRALPGEVGLGHALGLARLTGTSALPNTTADGVTGAWAGPFVFGTLDVTVADPLFLEIAAQLGVVTFPVRGLVQGDADIAIAGIWSGLSLGLGLNL